MIHQRVVLILGPHRAPAGAFNAGLPVARGRAHTARAFSAKLAGEK